MSRSPHFRKIELAVFAAAMALTLPLVAGFLGRLHPALDAFSHFRVHIAVAIILLALPLLAGAFRREAVMAMALGLGAIGTVTGFAVLPGLGAVEAAFQPKDAPGPVYRLLQMNLRFDNAEPDKVLSMIGRVKPDIITLEEAEGRWRPKLALLDAAYPYRVVCPGSDVVILSQRAFAGGDAGGCLQRTSFASARIDLGGRSVDIVALHLHWPWPFGQSRDVARLREPLAALSDSAIVAGDFNATPWSATARQIAAAGGLTRVAGFGPTWLYRRLPDSLRFAGLPIDQVFSKGDVVIHSVRTLEPAGSDHLPVLVEFSLRQAETRSSTASMMPGAPEG